MNLLQETLESLSAEGKTVMDIAWVGDYLQWFTWEEFAAIADITYDNQSGGVEVAQDLVIVGLDWWLERTEYDGKECWEYRTMPTRQVTHQVPRFLSTGQVPGAEACPYLHQLNAEH